MDDDESGPKRKLNRGITWSNIIIFLVDGAMGYSTHLLDRVVHGETIEQEREAKTLRLILGS